MKSFSHIFLATLTLTFTANAAEGWYSSPAPTVRDLFSKVLIVDVDTTQLEFTGDASRGYSSYKNKCMYNEINGQNDCDALIMIGEARGKDIQMEAWFIPSTRLFQTGRVFEFTLKQSTLDTPLEQFKTVVLPIYLQEKKFSQKGELQLTLSRFFSDENDRILVESGSLNLVREWKSKEGVASDTVDLKLDHGFFVHPASSGKVLGKKLCAVNACQNERYYQSRLEQHMTLTGFMRSLFDEILPNRSAKTPY